MSAASLGKALPAVLVLVFMYGMIMPSLALKCYITYTKDASTPPERSTQVLAVDDMQNGYFCTRFQVKGKWSYGTTDASSCALMKQNPEAYNNWPMAKSAGPIHLEYLHCPRCLALWIPVRTINGGPHGGHGRNTKPVVCRDGERV
jgi:hypothetical protein